MAIIRLSRKAYFHNLDIIAQKVGAVSKIAVVLKDNAYGHGLLEMAALSKEYGITDAVVHNSSEANKIKAYFDRILVLAGDTYIVDEKLQYAVNALSQIEKMPRGTSVELKVDTGMHRNGVILDEIEEALALISEKGLILKGVLTHNRSADTLSSEWFWQRQNFDKAKKKVLALQDKYGYAKPRFHSSNSAAAFRFKAFDEDLVRVGIAAYGCLEMDRTLEQPDLQPVMTLVAHKIGTRRLNRGEHVGYNATFKAEKEMVVSTYDLGYGDGLLRAASNRYTTPDGAKLLGRISMDNSSYTGDKETLVIFENANEYAKVSGTIGYEVLVGLHPDIKRVVI